MKIRFDAKKKKWVTAKSTDKDKIVFDDKLFQKLKNIRILQEKEFDTVILIDGDRRVGKSILGMQIGWILSDTTLTLKNFAIGSAQAKQRIRELPDRSVLIVDEGSMVFNSKDAMKNELKELIKVMDVVGQKEMIFIINLPTFFDLVRPMATRLSRCLIHVYTDKEYNRDRFAYYSTPKKNKLYSIGKKNFDSYKIPEPSFKRRFSNWKVPFYKDYLAFKKKTMLIALGDKKEPSKADRRLIELEMIKKNMENSDKNSQITAKQLGFLLGITDRQVYRLIEDIEGGV